MRTALLVALLTLPSLACAADDAPVAFVSVPVPQRIAEGKAMAACQAEAADLKKGNVIMPTPAFVATVGGAVLLAIGGGIAIGVAASKPKP
jgi:hypothetical protein